MRLSTFNSNFSPLVQGLAVAIAAILLAWAAIPEHLPSDETIAAVNAATLNEIVVEQFINQYRQRPVVLIGSSILTLIPPQNCLPDNVASIYLQGGGAMTGFEILRRIAAYPKTLFVEVSNLGLDVDQEFVATVFPPYYWRIRSAIPPLRQNRNWIVMLYRSKVHDSAPPSFTIDWPKQSVAEWNESRATSILPVLKMFYKGFNSEKIITEVVERVRMMQQGGTRVVFYDSIDGRLRVLPEYRHFKEKLRSLLPDVEMIEAPDGDAPLYRWDGMHFVDASGLWFFNFLMTRAGIAFTPKCQLATITPAL